MDEVIPDHKDDDTATETDHIRDPEDGKLEGLADLADPIKVQAVDKASPTEERKQRHSHEADYCIDNDAAAVVELVEKVLDSHMPFDCGSIRKGGSQSQGTGNFDNIVRAKKRTVDPRQT